MKQRLDVVLVEKGLAPSRQVAQALILSGRVVVDGQRGGKPGSKVDPVALITVDQPEFSFVGRGGVKLAGALDQFGIDVTGRLALDVGASTGGFTDCLLQRGAARVVALDVGRGQLDWKLRNDPRVVVVEGVNARYLAPGDVAELAGGADLIVIDVSFISLRMILPRVAAMLRPAPALSRVVALVKPQFEVGRGKVGAGGIVRDPALRREALVGVARSCASLGLGVAGMARSAITGSEGNVEYFLHLVPGGDELEFFTTERIEQESHRLIREETEHA